MLIPLDHALIAAAAEALDAEFEIEADKANHLDFSEPDWADFEGSEVWDDDPGYEEYDLARLMSEAL